jgi:hypothetical protein
MGFELVVIGGIVAAFLAFYAIGKYSSATPADFLDWKPTRSYEMEIELEQQDVEQMIEAQNERRRRDGRPLIDIEAYRNMVEMEGRDGDVTDRPVKKPSEEQRQRWAYRERRGF